MVREGHPVGLVAGNGLYLNMGGDCMRVHFMCIL